jgi:NAD+ dependent glucose-6-phosphate dehydrogenase
MKTVLITGATGNIGRKLRAHLGATGKYALRLLCLNPGADPEVQTADLTAYDEAWARQFAGVDTVLHVAADPSPRAGWRRIQERNLDLLLNVMAAAQLHGVRRVVFASSNFVVAGHRFADSKLTTVMDPAPINAYGASKLFGERIGKMFTERYGVSFIAFRIGVCQGAHDNRHGPWIPFGYWGQQMWVSDRDLCRAFEHAIDDERIGFGVYNLVSNNPGMRWEIDTLRDALGFVPKDGEPMRVSFAHRARAGMAWLRDVALPKIGAWLAGPRW